MPWLRPQSGHTASTNTSHAVAAFVNCLQTRAGLPFSHVVQGGAGFIGDGVSEIFQLNIILNFSYFYSFAESFLLSP